MSTPIDWSAFPCAADAVAPGLTAQEFAAIQLRVPQSGTAWLDAMITEARRLDLVQACAAALVVNGCSPEELAYLSTEAAAAVMAPTVP